MSAAERAVVAHVLERGYLSPEALASLEAEGPAEDFLRRLATALPARRDELRAAWQRALDDAPTLPPPSGALGPGADAPTLSPGPSVLGPVPSPSSPAHRSEPLPAVGERVGPYAVESVLGRGGMGVVYAARHTVSGRRVALKMLAADRVDDPSALERFAREAEATARLRHPGLVAVHERGEHRGNPWFAMELVDGRSLDRVLAEEGPLEVASACALARQCAEAVDAAHRAGVLHRDLKPANLLLTADGRVRVTDFGLARLTTASRASLTRTGEAVGTPAYMSPEQAEGDG
ncbi:MAG: serine/threonine protein kinase, partial [Planctomycetota bacterium]